MPCPRPANADRAIARRPTLRPALLAWLLAGLLAAPSVPAAAADRTIHDFGGAGDGALPNSSLARDLRGDLFGTTELGGSAGEGTVFKLAPDGTETVLHSFLGAGDGVQPQNGVVLSPGGSIYGVTPGGGAFGWGTIWLVRPDGTETVLYQFQGKSDGGQPFCDLVADGAGNLYGTAFIGGRFGQGVVFKLSPSGRYSVLHDFTGLADGANPFGGLAMDAMGDLFGATWFGANQNFGAIFRLTQRGGFQTLHVFGGGGDGSFPNGDLILDRFGNLFGTTRGGEIGEAAGTVFRLSADGTERVLYRFPQVSIDGSHPVGRLARTPTGVLVGAADGGGPANEGLLYSVTAGGQLSVLHWFTGGSDGGHPHAGPILMPGGVEDGTASSGGAFGGGVVYDRSIANPDGTRHPR